MKYLLVILIAATSGPSDGLRSLQIAENGSEDASLEACWQSGTRCPGDQSQPTANVEPGPVAGSRHEW